MQLVKLFALHGAYVASIATSHTKEICDEVNAVQSAHRVSFVSGNLTEEQGVNQVFADLDRNLGTPDILFNNAGISQRKRVPRCEAG